jgi:1,4-dihydroxy-6-naphthoate synthase
MLTSIRLAHSPDTDDVFMMDGIASGAVDCRGLAFEAVAADIESLNRRADAAELDVTAISFAAYPHVAHRYDLLPVGSSFGLGHGPKVVARAAADRPRSTADLEGVAIAVPGARTTAALLLGLAVREPTTVTWAFEDVARAVAEGEVDAGVVIHEHQLTVERRGLREVLDLGQWWDRETGGLPVPLGACAIRRDLPRNVVRDVKAVLGDSIRHALEHRSAALERSLAPDRHLDEATGDRYVRMYVNELTLEAGTSGRKAVEEMLGRGARAGLVPRVGEVRWA